MASAEAPRVRAAGGRDHDLQFRILGPLEVVRGTDRVDIGGPKQRAVLALLLLDRDTVVPVGRVIDGLWGDQPPASAIGTLHAYVSNLRRALEPDREPGREPSVLMTQPPGYRLAVAPEQVDAVVFENLVAEAAAVLTTGDLDAARARLADAQAMWRGPALAEVAYESFALAEISRLEELRLHAIELGADVDLAAGRHADVPARLGPALAANPLRPRLRAALMLALYRCGRQADALRVYQEGRAVVRAELGVEPEAELQELEEKILLQDASLDWRPAGPAAPTAPRAPAVETLGGPLLVGRDPELAVLDAALTEAMAGRGSVVLLEGEPGIGKTRLAEAAADHAAARDAVVAWGRSFEAEASPAFWPWVEALRAMLAEVGVDALDDLGAERALLARLLPELGATPLDVAGDERVRFSLYDAVGRVLEGLSLRRPIVVVLDDLHWADAASLRVLRVLAARVHGSRLLVIATLRDDEPHDDIAGLLADLSREPAVTRIALGGLGEGDVGRVIADTTAQPATDDLVRTITERTGGNPFFVGELVRLLTAPGGLDEVRSEVPVGVREVIRRRVGGLPPAALGLFVAGAVIGREFDLTIAASVAGVALDDALDAADAAVAVRLLEEGQRVGIYRFAHALVQDALASDVSGLRRSRLHARVADALRAAGGDRPEELGEVARHALLGADAETAAAALDAARVAAAAALDSLAFEDAESLAALALDVAARLHLADAATCFSLQLVLGLARRRRGEYRGARTVLEDAIATARTLGADELARAALEFGGGTWWGWWSEVGFVDREAVAALEDALAALPPSPSPRRVEVLGRLAVELHFSDETAARRDDLTADALAMARVLDDRALGRALADRHVAVWRPGNAGERRVLADELVAVARRTGALELEAAGHHFLMLSALERGDVAASMAQLEEERRIIARLPLPHLVAQAAWATSMFALLEGRSTDAERLIGANVETTSRWSADEAMRTWSSQIAVLRWQQGRALELEDGLRHLVATEAISVNWKTALALFLADGGRAAEAREVFADVAAQGFRDIPSDLNLLFYVAVRAEAVWLLDDAEAAALVRPLLEPYLGTSVVTATRLVYAGPVTYLAGSLDAVVGRLDAAEARLVAGVEEARRAGALPYVARGLERLAVVLERAGKRARAREVAGEASALGTSLGMVTLAARVAARQ